MSRRRSGVKAMQEASMGKKMQGYHEWWEFKRRKTRKSKNGALLKSETMCVSFDICVC